MHTSLIFISKISKISVGCKNYVEYQYYVMCQLIGKIGKLEFFHKLEKVYDYDVVFNLENKLLTILQCHPKIS